MPIRPRTGGWQVEVNDAAALEGFRRVRQQVNTTYSDAEKVENDIKTALSVYGKWPVDAGDRPLHLNQSAKPIVTTLRGTLRKAASIALTSHWANHDGDFSSKQTLVWNMVSYFEDIRKKPEIDDIDSDDTDAFIEHCKTLGNKATTINAKLSNLKVINSIAIKRKPALATSVIPISKLKLPVVDKWWMKPEDFEKSVNWLNAQGEQIFADYISVLILQGLRVGEGLRIKPRHFTGLDTAAPWMKVPGSKTETSGDSIPVFEDCVEVCRRSVYRAEERGFPRLFPFSWVEVSNRWNKVRDLLGVSDVNSATLRALRRTFAYYANQRAMPTRTLQKVLRHGSIGTTETYLRLVGTNEVEQSRDYFATEKKQDLNEAIAAFRATGASPEEIARFTKELLK